MNKKSNIRSIRFSDEIMEMIEQQAGANFTQKFENLVTRCMFELPAKEKELASVQEQINWKKKQLNESYKVVQDLKYRTSTMVQNLNRLEQAIKETEKELFANSKKRNTE